MKCATFCGSEQVLFARDKTLFLQEHTDAGQTYVESNPRETLRDFVSQVKRVCMHRQCVYRIDAFAEQFLVFEGCMLV